MYRQFLKSYCTRAEQFDKNKKAPENQKYCNFICQKYISVELFYENDLKNYCIECANYFALTKKYIKNGLITKEQFKENYNITKDIKESKNTINISKTINCVECKVEKTLDKFDHNRNICKECRHKQALNRTNKDLEDDISKIDEIKDNIQNLTLYIRHLPVNKLQQITKHYNVGRKSTDKKNDTIARIIEHFQKLQHPNKCLGNCGYDIIEKFSYCNNCKEKPKKTTIEERNLEFKQNLPVFMENLYEITKEELNETDIYNCTKLYYIAEYLEIKFNKTYNSKEKICEMINEKLKPKRDKGVLIQTKSDHLELNGVSMSFREDGYVNATQMCKAGGKKFNDWYKIDRTKEFLNELSRSTNIFVDLLIDIISTGPNENRGTWVHPRISINIAQWISPFFDVQVSGWVYEIAITGTVKLGYEKTNQELLKLQQDYKKLESKHHKLLEKKSYHKFKKGPVFYIISDNESNCIKYKPGIETVSINNRMRSHRSTIGGVKLEYLIYTNECTLIEKNILTMYKVKKHYKNHEWIYTVNKDHIINSVKTFLTLLGIEFTEELNLDKYNEQINNDLESDDEDFDEDE